MNITVLKYGFACILGLLLVTTITWEGFISQSIEFKQWLPLLKRDSNRYEDTMRKPKDVVFCKGCKDIIDQVSTYFSDPWKKQKNKLTSVLRKKGRGAKLAILTQNNTPLNTKILDHEKKGIEVTPSLFRTLPKDPPFTSTRFNTCSVVGNGGILNNSFCGQHIDSAEFVFRCNLPPVNNGFEKHVGNRTDFVTANPSIFFHKFHALEKNTDTFVDFMEIYGHSWVLLPAVYHSSQVEVCLRAINILNDRGSPLRPIFLNPAYVNNLQKIWRGRHLKERRLSTGFVMVNLALELCNSVDLYGFWPFMIHPHDFNPLNNHYYDTKRPNKRYHEMPTEFKHLLTLHKKGVLKIHLGDCRPQQS